MKGEDSFNRDSGKENMSERVCCEKGKCFVGTVASFISREVAVVTVQAKKVR